MPSCTLSIKAVPNARRDEVVGWDGDVLKLKIRAPAVDGRANDALLAFLAETVGVARSRVTLVRGEKARLKVVQIDGADLTTVKRLLNG